MKRTNVILDEQVLEEARRLAGERTYSSTINRALQELVKKQEGQQAAWRLMEQIMNDPEAFYPGYAEELFGEQKAREMRRKLKQKGWTVREDPPMAPSKAVAAMKISAPKKRRGSRR
jgi:nitroimidazol reductase NimA-like FMN-containing flavoprotein (pyridoxamine 5'-phosphate oxidase superfamily)